MLKKYLSKISGTGMYVPNKILTNSDLEKIVDTNDEWITKRTGMKERRIADENQATSDLGYHAALNAIEASGINKKDIGLIIFATITPDHMFPSTACILQKKLGIKDFPAFDISAGCTGFVYAMDVARQYVENGIAEHALVVAGETLSKIINWKDRGTCVLFGDGVGAAVVSRAEDSDISKIIDIELSADGKKGDILVQQAGGSVMPASEKTVSENLHTIQMEGNKVFKLAVKSMQRAAKSILHRNNLDNKDIDWIITHQANLRIIQSLAKKLKLDSNKVIVNIEKYANTSAGTIPIALDENIRNKKIRKGDLVLTAAFGAGLTSGALLFRY